MLTLPKILDIPSKLLPLITQFNDYRYFLIEGGRASGKSQSITRFLLYLCEQKQIRVVGGRETQLTIDESVYTIFADLIRIHNLNFNVSATKIDDRETKSAIRFRGFRQQGAMNIKGLEGVDILWVEEAQAISKQTLDIILPTIRKENSKIIWSMNRHIEHDPVYVAMAGRKNCLHIHIDYHENPFCPEAMIEEANVCKELCEDDYNHIWLGQPLKKGDDVLLSTDDIYEAPKRQFLDEGTQRIILAVDVARFGEDETVFTAIKSKNIFAWEQILQESWKNKDLMQVCGKILDLKRTLQPDIVVIDDVGMGGGVTDRLRELREPVEAFIGNERPDNVLYADKRSEGFFKLKDIFIKQYIKLMADRPLQEQLMSLRYKFKSNGKKCIVSKDEMKKDGVKSPDRADALMMAMYYIDKVFRQKLNPNLPRETEV